MPVPPVHDHSVDHTTVSPLTDSSVEHCEPEVAPPSPQRSVNRVYEPDVTESYCPQSVVARRWSAEAETRGRSKSNAEQEIIVNESNVMEHGNRGT